MAFFTPKRATYGLGAYLRQCKFSVPGSLAILPPPTLSFAHGDEIRVRDAHESGAMVRRACSDSLASDTFAILGVSPIVASIPVPIV